MGVFPSLVRVARWGLAAGVFPGVFAVGTLLWLRGALFAPVLTRKVGGRFMIVLFLDVHSAQNSHDNYRRGRGGYLLAARCCAIRGIVRNSRRRRCAFSRLPLALGPALWGLAAGRALGARVWARVEGGAGGAVAGLGSRTALAVDRKSVV